ncbi:hypothetical protein MS6016_42720 [Klebsiella variicola]|nr:hypothetical protein MS6016_42720 [Klebsiella variicola]
MFDVGRVRRKPPPGKIAASPGSPDKAPAAIRELPPLALRLAGLQTERFVFYVGRVRRKPPPGKIAASPGSPEKAPAAIRELPRSHRA